MIAEQNAYWIWVDWDQRVASLQPTEGFEMLCFFSRESYQENLRILTSSGFQIRQEVTP